METNTVVLDLDTYNELIKTAMKYEEMKEEKKQKIRKSSNDNYKFN